PASLALATEIWSLSRFMITTNYDNCLVWAGERKFETPPRMVNIESSKDDLIDAVNRTVTRPTIWHIHGHIDEPHGLVLDPGGYDDIYTANAVGGSRFEAARSVLRTLLAARSLLFIGFSLDDPYFVRQIESVAHVFGGRGGPHFAL